MKILIYALNFAPELVGCAKYNTELAEFLAGQGHEVKVICAPPYYPYWQVQKPFSSWHYHRSKNPVRVPSPTQPASDFFHKQEENTTTPSTINHLSDRDFFHKREKNKTDPGTINKPSACDFHHNQEGTSQTKDAEPASRQRNPQAPLVCESSHNQGENNKTYEVIRCPIYVPAQPTGLKRLVHLASFALSSFLPLMTQWRFKPDLVFTVAPTLFSAPGAALLAKICRARSWLHIQDFETDAAFETGILKNQLIKSAALFIEKMIIQSFNTTSTISVNMSQRLSEKGVTPDSIHLLPNWVDTNIIFKMIKSSKTRQSLKLDAQTAVCLFSGNIGLKQAPGMIIEAAEILKNHPGIHFIICGEGPEKKALQQKTKNLSNISFLELQPPEELNELLNTADIHLLPQLSGAADLVMPSKLTGMLASGRPVVASAAAGTEIARAVEGRGLVTPPGDPKAFAAAILQLAQDALLRAKLGDNARAYAEQNLDKNAILTAFNHFICQGR